MIHNYFKNNPLQRDYRKEIIEIWTESAKHCCLIFFNGSILHRTQGMIIICNPVTDVTRYSSKALWAPILNLVPILKRPCARLWCMWDISQMSGSAFTSSPSGKHALRPAVFYHTQIRSGVP